MGSLHTRWNAFFSRRSANTVLRLALFFIAVYLIALSIALARTAGLGTSPIASIPNVMSYIFPQFTIGMFQFLFNVLMVLAQICLNRSFRKPVEFIQLIMVFFFSAFVDFNVSLLQGLPVEGYAVQWFWTVLSIFLLGFGVMLELFADTVIMPGEGIIVSISQKWNKKFSACKVGFDASNVIVAAIISLCVFGWLNGVREGTVATALFTGVIVGMFKKLCGGIQDWIPAKPEKTDASHMPVAQAQHDTSTGIDADELATEYPLVITISREYGSRGREIARVIADRLGIDCYDKDMIDLVAQKTGMTADYVADHEEEAIHGLLYFEAYQFSRENPSQEDALFLAQTSVITSLAQEKSCVFVGRLSNFILGKRPNRFDVFVTAPLEARISHVIERENRDEQAARRKIARIDAQRAKRCKRYTGKNWGAADNYDLSIDSSHLTIERAAQIIIDAAQAVPTARS